MKTGFPLSKNSIKTHFQYSWWKYLFVLILAIVIPTFVFSVRRYESPADKRLDFFMVDASPSETYSEAFFRSIIDRTADVELETVTCECQTTDATGQVEQVIAIRLAFSREEDIVIMPRTFFTQYAQQGVFLPLDEADAELEAITTAEDRAKGTCSYDGSAHVYGIPLDRYTGMYDASAVIGTDLFISVFFDSGNQDNALKVFNSILTLSLPEASGAAE